MVTAALTIQNSFRRLKRNSEENVVSDLADYNESMRNTKREIIEDFKGSFEIVV